MKWQKIRYQIKTKHNKHFFKLDQSSLKSRITGASEKAEDVIHFWNSLPNTRTHGMNTKMVRSTIVHIDSRLMQGRQPKTKIKIANRIKRVMTTFNNLLEEKIIDTPGISILEFFKGSTYRKENIIYYRLLQNKEQLGIFLAERGVSNQYSKAKDRLQTIYAKYVLGQDVEKLIFTKVQLEQFGLASRRLVRYMKDNKTLDFFDYSKGAVLDDFIRVMIQALKQHYWKERNLDFGVGHLCSNYTFSEVLPKYIARMRRR